MALLVMLLGFAVAAVAVVGLAAPRRVGHAIRSWPPRSRFRFAVGIRLVFGTALLVAASACRFSAAIFALGAVALAAALVLALLGQGRVDSLIRWWLDLPPTVLRVSFGMAALFGGFLVYASL